MRKFFCFFMFLFIIVFSFSVDLNLNHLDFLRDKFLIEDEEFYGYWIYADNIGNNYIKKGVSEEGVSCVDDVARVAIVYSELYKIENDELYKMRVKEALDFVLAFQDIDGDFYNFVFDDGSINKLGVTSRKSGSWWAARAYWAISNCLYMFDGDYKNILIKSAKSVEKILENNLNEFGLINGYSDISSIFLLGLTEFYKETNDKQSFDIALRVADGIMSTQFESGVFKGAYNESKDSFLWHSWGSRQAEALIDFYSICKDEKYLNSAIFYADNIFNLILSFGPVYESKDFIKLYEQISYGIETYISTASKLYNITKKDKYGYYTAFLYSFFEGNNNPNLIMYGDNGEGFDGLHSVYVNSNSGAESTISYLLSKIRLFNIPEKYFKFSDVVFSKYSSAKILEAEKLNSGIYSFSMDNKNNVRIEADSKIVLKNNFLKSLKGNYYIYVSGEFNDGSFLKVYSSSNKSEQRLTYDNGFYYGGKLYCDSNKITFSFNSDSKMFIDQILLIPEDYLFVFSRDDLNYFFDGFEVKETDMNTFSNEVKGLSFFIEYEDYNNSKLLDLKDVYNNNGIVSYDERKKGNFDNPEGIVGASFSYEEFKKKDKNLVFSFDDSYFKVMNYENDNFVLSSQTFLFKEDLKGNSLYIVGASDHGSYSSDFIIYYDDGLVQKESLRFSDWCQKTFFDESIFLSFDYRYGNTGIQENISNHLFLNKFDLRNESISKIIFSSKPTMHIFSITIR